MRFLTIFLLRFSSQAAVYIIDDLTGGLELSHTIELSAKDFPGSPGSVREMKWTPDGCAVMLSWSKGGISLWSTFGAMLMCSLGWDYGLNVDLALRNPLDITCMVSLIAMAFFSYDFDEVSCYFVSREFDKRRGLRISNALFFLFCLLKGLVDGRLSAVHVTPTENL